MPENQGGQASTKAGTKAAIKSPRTRCSCSLAGYHDQRRIVPYAHDRTQFVASVVHCPQTVAPHFLGPVWARFHDTHPSWKR